MKALIIISLVMIPLFSGCQKDDNNDSKAEIREIAWNSLSAQEKSSVISNWKEAPVTEAVYKERKAYMVSFNTNNDALLGPISVFVDMTTKKILGEGLRN